MSETDIEGEARPALLVEGATRATQRLIEGEASAALLTEGATRAPLIVHRASREYRCDMVHVMVRRALGQVLQGR